MKREQTPTPEFTPEELKEIEVMQHKMEKLVGYDAETALRIARVSMHSLKKEAKEASGKKGPEAFERTHPDLR